MRHSVQRKDSTETMTIRELTNSMFKLPDTIRSTQTPNGRICLELHRGEMFSVNEVGSKIIELLELGQDEAHIATEISSTCGVSIEIATADVRDFLVALQEYGVLQRRDSTAASTGFARD
jgi:hypothetical protein